MRRRILGFILVGACTICSVSTAVAAPQFFVSVTGAKQGPFKGEAAGKGLDGKFAGLLFDYSLDTPRDPLTAQLTGKRLHRPISIKKAWGPASVQFFAALVGNESLAVTIDFVTVDASGALVLDHSIKLSNAFVSQYSSHSDANNPQSPPVDMIQLVFQKIDIIDHKGKLTATDVWIAPQ